MCGIVYVHGDKPVAKRVIKKYTKQRNRGNEGFGFVTFSNGIIKNYKRYQNETETLKALKSIEDTHILFHHRYPTSTENVVETAHPIKVSHPELLHDYYVVHNGVISNPGTLKTQHERLGYKYTTELKLQYIAANGTVYKGDTQFNDTESLAIELARNIELGTPIMATGSAAFIVLQVKKNGKKVHRLIYGTNGGNPLMVNRTDTRSISISSEGGGEAVRPMIMYMLDISSNVLTSSLLDMPGYINRATTVGYGAYNSPYNYTELWNNDDDEIIEYEKPSTRPELEAMLIEIERDIKIAKQSGEEDELADLLIEKTAIQESLLEYNYYANNY